MNVAAEIFFYIAVAFGPLAFGAVESWSQITLIILIFLVFLCSIFRPRVTRSNDVNGILWGIVGVAIIGVLQIFNERSLLLPADLIPFTAASSKTRFSVALWSAYGALVWSITRIFDQPNKRRRLAWFLLVLGFLISVMGIAQRGQGNLSYYGVRPVVGLVNPFGPYVNYDHAASMMILCLFIGIGLLFAQFQALRTERNRKLRVDRYFIQALILFMLGTILFGIMETGSRGGLFVLGFVTWVGGGLWSLGLHSRSLRRGVRIGLGLIGVGALIMLWHLPRWTGFLHHQGDMSVTYRLSIYRSTLQLIYDFPFWGTGLGSFERVFPCYQEPVVRGIVEHTHCDWLELMAEVGIVGFSIYIAGLIHCLYRSLGTWQMSNYEERWLVVGALAAVFSFSLHNLIEFSFQIPANAILFFVILVFAGMKRDSAVALYP